MDLLKRVGEFIKIFFLYQIASIAVITWDEKKFSKAYIVIISINTALPIRASLSSIMSSSSKYSNHIYLTNLSESV